jgi:hypothetical protein
MSDEQKKGIDDRKDTFALLTGTAVVGTFISLMAGMVPLAIAIAVGSIFAAKKVLSNPIG